MNKFIRIQREVNLDISNNIVSPSKLFIIVFISILILYFISPIKYVIINPDVYKFVFFSAVAFLLGCALYGALYNITGEDRAKKSKEFTQISRGYIRIVFYILSIIALFGLLGRVADQLINRGLDLSEGVTQGRIIALSEASRVGTRATVFSVMSAFAFAFCIPAFVIARRWARHFSPSEKVFSYAVAAEPALDSIVKGGISNVIVSIALIYFCLQNYGSKATIRIGKPLVIISLTLAIFVGSSLFKERVEVFYKDVNAFFVEKMNSNPVIYDRTALDMLESPIAGGGIFTYLWLSDYVMHPLSELSIIVGDERIANQTDGSYQFAVLIRGISILFNEEDIPLNIYNPRQGKYQTFLTDALIDFGYYGAILEVLLCGFLAQAAYLNLKMGGMFGGMMYPLVQVVIVQSFLINGLNGTGFYFISASMISLLILNSAPKNVLNKNRVVI